MKKTLFLAVFAGAALAGCVKNEEVAKNSGGSPERITFDAPVVGVPTRAEEIVGNYPKDRNFAVYALYHVGSFSSFGAAGTQLYMDNVTCTAKNSSGSNLGETDEPAYWAPDKNYYWPKNDGAMLTFAAYAPAGMTTIPAGNTDVEGVKWDATGFTFQNFTVADTPAEQKDLLYSAREYDKTSGDMLALPGTVPTPDNHADPYGGITILFKHALSSIVFTARAEEANAVILKKIEVMNVIRTGTFNQGYNGDGTKSDENAQWNFPASPDRTKTYVVFDASVEDVDPIALTKSKQYFGAETSDSDSDGKRKSDLILIPQTLDTEGNKVCVSITYSINGVEDTKVMNLAVVNPTPGEGNSNALLYKWEMGYRYTYDIVIGLNKIYFNPTVTIWQTGTGTGTENTTTI